MPMPARPFTLVVMKPLLARAAMLLVLAAGLGAVVNGLRGDGLRPGQFQVATTCGAGGATAPVAGGQTPPVTEIHAWDAVRLCGDPGVMVADVRTSERFAAGHVADAVHLPCASSATAASGALSLLARRHTVVVYGDTTADAREVAEALRPRLGDGGKVLVLAGGFGAWERAGLACSSGPCPECQKRAELP
jgi:rhodanese-related sulfurtransferase